MFIRRLTADSWIEKQHAIVGFLLLISAVTSTYLIVANYSKINIYCMIGYALALFALFTTGIGIKDYKSNKNVHKGSFTHYINSINIAHLSLLGEFRKDDYVAEKKGKDASSLAFTVFFLGIFPFVLTGLYWAFGEESNYKPFLLASLNLFLIFIDISYSGFSLNNLKIEDEKLAELFMINDLTDTEKNKLRKALSKEIENKGFITRYSLYKICNKLKEEQIKRKQKEAIGLDFGSGDSPNQSRKIGDVFEKRSGGTKELL